MSTSSVSLQDRLASLKIRLGAVPDITVREKEPLSRYTRFGIGGPAGLFVDCPAIDPFLTAWRLARQSGVPMEVLGGGSNVVVSDQGYPGVVLRYRGVRLEQHGQRVTVEAGVELQHLVDFTIERGLKGLETMTGIPGWVGAAIYGNAGAYGHSISERIVSVRHFDGAAVRELDREACRFRYRDSIFKDHKDWVILGAELEMDTGDPAELRRIAEEIRAIRDKKYPPSMRCAGSIFKNLLYTELPPSVAAEVPPHVIIEGKVPAAWFLERVGAKGLRRGDIQVAPYHANLIYNDGAGTASDLREIIQELKRRVQERFGLKLEEEVQFVGFDGS
jgi:UDP-N-acetylmuramate dehydrogenase